MKFTLTKTTIFLIKKKQTTPNLQFAGDVKFAGDNPIDPLSNPKNITLKINETPFIGEIVSITTFPQRDNEKAFLS